MIQVFKSFLTDSMVAFYSINTLQILSAIGLAGLLISPFFFPQILYGLPQIKDQIPHIELTAPPFTPLKEEVRRESLSYESHYIDFIRGKADQVMNDEQPFLVVDFNLSLLFVLIHIPAYHLAFYFKEIKK